jgi:hypothetical protein
MKTLCATRSMKVLKYLNRIAPESLSGSSLSALKTLPSDALSELHNGSDLAKVTQDETLVNWLKKHPAPRPKAEVSGPLFHGTLVFVRIVFARLGQPDSSVSLADVQVAADYATLAVGPIQRYASQYGPNSVSVYQTPLELTAKLDGNSFSVTDLEGWVEEMAQVARENQVPNPCVVVLHDRSVFNTPTYTGHRNSYHSVTGDGTQYCYCLVFGQNLSIADNNHTIGNKATDKVYAHLLSHEIAEMVVDPSANDSNPEVCDACAGNCSVSLFDLFDQNGGFLGGTPDTASATGFSFFINPIVRPASYDSSTQCVIKGGDTQSACIYPPPFVNNAIYSTAWDAATGWASGWFDVPGGGAANPGSPVTAIARNPNHLDLFVTGTDGQIYSTYWDAATGWAGGWFDIPGGGAANPGSPVTVVARNPDHLDLFVTGTDGQIYSTSWDAASNWAGDWFGVPGGAATSLGSLVTVIARNPDHLDLFVTGTDGQIYSTYWDTAGGWAGGWFGVPGSLAANPGSPVTVVARNPDHLDLFVTGTDGQIYSTSWDAASSWGTGWFVVPGGVGTNLGSLVTVIARNPDHLDLFVTGTDGQIYSTYWDTAGGWAGGWFGVPGGLAANPGATVTAIARNPDHLDLFVTGADGQIYSTSWDAASSWGTGWFVVPGGGPAGPGSTVTAIARNPDHLDLYVTG